MRGDVYRVHLDGSGHVQRGARYCVVVQATDLMLSTVLVCPTSTGATPSLLHPIVDFGDRPTQVLVEQLRVVDGMVLGEPVGHLTYDEMAAVALALRLVLDLPTS